MWLDPTVALASLKPDAPMVYQLLIRVDRPLALGIGSLGRMQLHAGWYVYSGSARRAAAARLARHLRKRKPKRWHIDYLLTCRQVGVVAIRLWPWQPGLECEVNQCLIDKELAEVVIPGFGSSDCRGRCGSHLLLLPAQASVFCLAMKRGRSTRQSNTSDKPILHICAPASPVGEDLECLGIHGWDGLGLAVQKALGRGWRITGDPSLIWAPFLPDQGGRTDDAARAADLEAAMADDRVRAIVSLRGGAWLLRILDRLDLDVLSRRRTPVYLVGFSEWTCLSLVASRYRSVVSVHHTSPAYMLATDPHKPLSQQQKQRRWHQIWTSIRQILDGQQPKQTLHGRLVTPHKLPEQTIQLIGGNLTLVAAMAGTPYQAAAMAVAISRQGGQTLEQPKGFDPAAQPWLALEDINETPGRIDRKFTQMRLAGMFDKFAGILLGGFHSDGRDTSHEVARLLQLHIPRTIPIVAGCNFGHFWPMAAFPVARPVRLTTGPRNLVRVEVDWRRLAGCS